MARERVSLADLQPPKPKNDAYTVLLSISLVAIIAACLLLWYSLKDYGKDLQPPKDYKDISTTKLPQRGSGVDENLPGIPTPPAGGGAPATPPGGNP